MATQQNKAIMVADVQSWISDLHAIATRLKPGYLPPEKIGELVAEIVIKGVGDRSEAALVFVVAQKQVKDRLLK